jgi:hypothetical protein
VNPLDGAPENASLGVELVDCHEHAARSSAPLLAYCPLESDVMPITNGGFSPAFPLADEPGAPPDRPSCYTRGRAKARARARRIRRNAPRKPTHDANEALRASSLELHTVQLAVSRTISPTSPSANPVLMAWTKSCARPAPCAPKAGPPRSSGYSSEGPWRRWRG